MKAILTDLRSHPSPIVAYGAAVVMVAATLALRQGIAVSVNDRPLLIMFVLPIMLSALLGGLGPGVLATGLAAGGLLFLVLPPVGHPALIQSHDLFQWGVLILTGLLTSLLSEGLRRARRIAEAERRIQMVTLSSIGDAVIATDAAARVTFINPVAERLTGWSAAEALGQPLHHVFSIIGETDRQSVEDPVSRVMACGTVVGLANHTLLVSRDGHEIPIHDSAAPIRSADGLMVGVVLVFQDDSANRAVETRLAQQTAQLRQLINTLPDLVWLKDIEGRYLFCNTRFEQLFGSSEAAILGRTDSDFVPAEQAEWFRSHDRRAMASGGPVSSEEWLYLADSGRRILVDTIKTPMRDPDGTVVGVLGIARDITNRRQAEEDLRRSNDRLRRITATVPGMLYDYGRRPDGTDAILYVSEYCREIFEVEPERAVEVPGLLQRMIDPEDNERMVTAQKESAARGELFSAEVRITTASGRQKWVQFISRPAMSADGAAAIRSGVVLDITQRKQASQQLDATQSQLRLFIENAPAALAMLDCDMRYLIVSRRWLTEYGVEADTVIGRSHYEIFPGTPERWREIHCRCLAGSSEKCDEDPFIREDGQTDWLRWEIRPWYESEGKVGGLLIMSENISERIFAREQLHKLSQAVEQSPSGILITDLVGRIEYVNDSFIAMTGYAREDLIGAKPGIVASGLTPQVTYDEMWQALSAGRVWQGEFINRRKSGEVYIDFARILPVRQESGAITHYLAIKDDITEKKRISRELELYRHNLEDVVELRTAALQAAEARQRLILESSADGLFGVDPAGILTFINPAACAILAREADEMLGKSSHTLIHHSRADGSPYPVEMCPIYATLADSQIRRVHDEVFWRGDGQSFPVAYAVRPMIQDGAIVGAVVSFSDITAQIETTAAREAALAEAQRLARLRRDFLANMSHEIRTPLNAVLGLAQIGRNEPQGYNVQSLFGRILDAGQALLEVVNDILDFSKIEAGKVHAERVPMVLGAAIDRAVAMIAPRAIEKGLAFRIDESPALPGVVLGDALRLSQVLGNLLSNAAKFTPAGGSVRVEALRDGDRMVFRVIDTGIGISTEQIGRLFQPFEQADGSTTRTFGGTGLGLSISRHLVTLMGGTISVESQPGQGSRFSIVLPLEAAEPNAPPASMGRPVALIGPRGGELNDLASALVARGCSVERYDTLDAVPQAEAVVVALDVDPAGRLMLHKLVQMGRRLAVVVDPGGAGVPAGLEDIASALERPLRARHVLADDMGVPGLLQGAGRRLAGYRILAAEDNEVNCLVLDEILTGAGARVACVSNGRLALDRLVRDGADAFDLVLADIQMPEMDGYDLTRAVCARYPGLPVVGVTAHAMPEEEARCLAVGMAAHVTKPIRAELLVEAVVRHARRPSAPTSVPPVEARIDWDGLAARYPGRVSFVERLLDTVIEVHAETAQRLRRAAEEGDGPTIGRIAHMVRGSFGNLQADGVWQLARDVERAAAENDAASSAQALVLAQSVEVLLASIRARRAESASPGAGGA